MPKYYSFDDRVSRHYSPTIEDSQECRKDMLKFGACTEIKIVDYPKQIKFKGTKRARKYFDEM
jgi:hypothetical protein